MLGFTIKKWFFDMWDNLLHIVACNLAMDLGLAIHLVPGGLGLPAIAGWVVAGLSILVFYVVLGTSNGITWKISKGEPFEWAGVKDSFKRGLVPSLVLAFLHVAIVMLSVFAWNFYASMDHFIGLVLAALIFWALVFWFMTVIWYMPFNAQMETSVKRILRKSFLVALGNPLYSIAILIGSVLILAISIFTFTMLPGVAGMLLWHQTALKLRLYKYDWLEAHPGTPNKAIPWGELLAGENERVGKRTLKGLIFPWKE